jgi:hypothetical protein
MINSAAITTADPLFDFLPRESRGWVFHQVGLSAGQLFLLPVMHWDRFWSGRKVIPQVFHELQFLRWTQVKDRGIGWMHLKSSYTDSSKQWITLALNRTGEWTRRGRSLVSAAVLGSAHTLGWALPTDASPPAMF